MIFKKLIFEKHSHLQRQNSKGSFCTLSKKHIQNIKVRDTCNRFTKENDRTKAEKKKEKEKKKMSQITVVCPRSGQGLLHQKSVPCHAGSPSSPPGPSPQFLAPPNSAALFLFFAFGGLQNFYCQNQGGAKSLHFPLLFISISVTQTRYGG